MNEGESINVLDHRRSDAVLRMAPSKSDRSRQPSSTLSNASSRVSYMHDLIKISYLL
jgi:hypothetical protein